MEQESSSGSAEEPRKAIKSESSRIESSWSSPSMSFHELENSTSGAGLASSVIASMLKKSSVQSKPSRSLRVLDFKFGSILAFGWGAYSGGEEGKAVQNTQMREMKGLSFMMRMLTAVSNEDQNDTHHDSFYLDQKVPDLEVSSLSLNDINLHAAFSPRR